jgi:intein/homing endonuclease
MADGTTKQIEDVQAGDFVTATDPETGESGSRRVIDTIVGGGKKELVDVSVDGSVITATGGHPFWVDGEGRWVDADDLAVGDRLLVSDGSTVAIDGIADRVAVQQVHNLTVDGIHTYYVIANDSAVVVHNQGGPCLDAIKIAQHADEAAHVVPGVDDLAQYVDDVLKTPGTDITRGRTAWWDPDTGAVVIREADGNGTVFVPDRGYDYYLDLLAE